MSKATAIPKPKPFLTVRCHDTAAAPSLCGLCVGYEQKAWRTGAFCDHVISWLPEFALTPSEWTSLNHANAVDLVRKAAQLVYTTKKFEDRGEFGELFLHAAIRQVHDSLPAISKLYYKSAINDTVKGFDAVHVVGPPDDMELWLGEAKFFDDIGDAIRKVVAELKDHLTQDYLRSEFLAIGNKIDDHWPHAPALKKLLARETSLDEVFSRVCIPVLLTYDSTCVSGFDQCSAAYVTAFEAEVRKHHATFSAKVKALALPAELRVHLFLFPLHDKVTLVNALDQKLKTWQKL